MKKLPPWPCEKRAMLPGPYFSLISARRLAVKSSASSQLTSRHCSSPPSLVRSSGCLQPVGVVERADAAGAARAEAAVRQRVRGVALDLVDLLVLHVGEHAALPEAQLAEGRHHAVGLDVALGGAGARVAAARPAVTAPAPTAVVPGDLQERPAGDGITHLRQSSSAGASCATAVVSMGSSGGTATVHALSAGHEVHLDEVVHGEPVLARDLDEPCSCAGCAAAARRWPAAPRARRRAR